MNRVFQESFDSVSVEWTASGDLTQSPTQISAVYEGQPLCVYATGLEKCVSATLVCRKGTAIYSTQLELCGGGEV